VLLAYSTHATATHLRNAQRNDQTNTELPHHRTIAVWEGMQWFGGQRRDGSSPSQSKSQMHESVLMLCCWSLSKSDSDEDPHNSADGKGNGRQRMEYWHCSCACFILLVASPQLKLHQRWKRSPEAPKLGREEVKSGKEAQEEECNESVASGPKWWCGCRKQLQEQAYVGKVKSSHRYRRESGQY